MEPLFKYFYSIYCWKSINGIFWIQQFEVTTHTVKTTAAFLWDFFSDHLHDPQTLCNLTSFFGDFLKKESTAATQEVWRTLT